MFPANLNKPKTFVKLAPKCIDYCIVLGGEKIGWGFKLGRREGRIEDKAQTNYTKPKQKRIKQSPNR